MSDRDLTEIERLLGAVRVEPDPDPDGALYARIFADAEAAQPTATAGTATAGAPVRGRLRRAWARLGGWPAAGGLVAATLAGLWIGISAPEILSGQFPAWLEPGAATAKAGTTDDWTLDPVSTYAYEMAYGG